MSKSFNSHRMAVNPFSTGIPQATVIPQAVLDAYRTPLSGIHRPLGHPVLYPTSPDNSSSIPSDGLPPSAFLLNSLCNASSSHNGHPLPESDSLNRASSSTRSTTVAQSSTTWIPRISTIPGPVYNTYGALFDGHSLQQGHLASLNPRQPMESSSATIPQGKASPVSDFSEDNATSARLEVQTPKAGPSKDNGDESFKEKPPHHRSAKASRSSKLWENITETRRSKASPNHPHPHKPKRKVKRPALVSNFKVRRRAPHKISLEASQTLIAEWKQLSPEEKSQLPVYEIASPTKCEEHHDRRWRCCFLDDKGQCDTWQRLKAEAERHSLTHYSVRWLCLNPSCGKAFSRDDAVKRHYNKAPVCKKHLPAVVNLENDATVAITGPVVSLGADGPKLVQIVWVTGSD